MDRGSEARSLDWHLLEWNDHQQIQRFVRPQPLLPEPALTKWISWEGFQWIDFTDAEQSISRSSAVPTTRPKCSSSSVTSAGGARQLPRRLPLGGAYREVINSDNLDMAAAARPTTPDSGRGAALAKLQFSAPLRLPPLGVLVLKPVQSAEG